MHHNHSTRVEIQNKIINFLSFFFVLKKALWMRYWEHKKLDPRVTYGKRRYTFPNCTSQLLSKAHLTEFWINTEPLVRLQIVGGLGSIVDTALRDSALESSSEKGGVPLTASPASISTFRKTRKGSDATRNHVFPHHDIRLLSALVDFSMEKKAVEFLFASHADKSKINHRAFIEILYFSPLKTAGNFYFGFSFFFFYSFILLIYDDS